MRLWAGLLIALLLTGAMFFADVQARVPSVQITTDAASYSSGKKVRVTLENLTDQPVWVSTSCGMPFILYTVNGCETEVHGAYPTKECYAPPLKVAPHSRITEKIKLEKVYGHVFFKILPGQYRFGIQYFHENPESTTPLPQPSFASSDVFVIE